jgi:hypothetical protein
MDRLSPRGLFPALFLVALVTIMYQVLLTRVFSLTMWYHFAFMAISIAMFGMTIGALVVFLRPAWWPVEKLASAMGRCAVLCAISFAVIFLHISLYVSDRPLRFQSSSRLSALPPFLAGISFAWHSRDSQRVGSSMPQTSQAPQAFRNRCPALAGRRVRFSSATLAASLESFCCGAKRALAVAVTATLAGTTIGSHLSRLSRSSLFRIESQSAAPTIEYERWNSFSRITVLPEPNPSWSLSSAFHGSLQVPNRWLHIDAIAGTQPSADGDLKR